MCIPCVVYSQVSRKYLNLVNIYFRLKDPPERPTMYLRADISKFMIPKSGNGVTCWDMSVYSHVKKTLQVVEAKLREEMSDLKH